MTDDQLLIELHFASRNPRGFRGCFVVAPVPGPRGGTSRPVRWRVDVMTRSGWVSALCFANQRGVRSARITGGILLWRARE